MKAIERDRLLEELFKRVRDENLTQKEKDHIHHVGTNLIYHYRQMNYSDGVDRIRLTNSQ